MEVMHNVIRPPLSERPFGLHHLEACREDREESQKLMQFGGDWLDSDRDLQKRGGKDIV